MEHTKKLCQSIQKRCRQKKKENKKTHKCNKTIEDKTVARLPPEIFVPLPFQVLSAVPLKSMPKSLAPPRDLGEEGITPSLMFQCFLVNYVN